MKVCPWKVNSCPGLFATKNPRSHNVSSTVSPFGSVKEENYRLDFAFTSAQYTVLYCCAKRCMLIWTCDPLSDRCTDWLRRTLFDSIGPRLSRWLDACLTFVTTMLLLNIIISAIEFLLWKMLVLTGDTFISLPYLMVFECKLCPLCVWWAIFSQFWHCG